jgi:hypothetical protein
MATILGIITLQNKYDNTHLQNKPSLTLTRPALKQENMPRNSCYNT